MNKNTAKKRHLLLVEASRCIGCGACEAACQLEHDLPAETAPIRVMALGPLGEEEALTLSFLPVTCYHCERPACVLACPTGAMQRRPDGIVISDPNLCIGCQTCAVACPFGVPQLNPARGKIAKCDSCLARLAQGTSPACVLSCPTDALRFDTPDRAVLAVRVQEALQVAQSWGSDGGAA